MGITIHYKGTATEEQADRVIEHFSKKPYTCTVVNVAYDERFDKQGHTQESDYEENWVGYECTSFARVYFEDLKPMRFKGIILRVDEGCEPVWFTFCLFEGKRKWQMAAFTKTQYASLGFATHIAVVSRLKELKGLISTLKVCDEAGLWETGDVKEASKNFGDSEMFIKQVGAILEKMAKESGGAVGGNFIMIQGKSN